MFKFVKTYCIMIKCYCTVRAAHLCGAKDRYCFTTGSTFIQKNVGILIMRSSQCKWGQCQHLTLAEGSTTEWMNTCVVNESNVRHRQETTGRHSWQCTNQKDSISH